MVCCVFLSDSATGSESESEDEGSGDGDQKTGDGAGAVSQVSDSRSLRQERCFVRIVMHGNLGLLIVCVIEFCG